MKVSNGCYYRLTVSPGDHVISHDHIFLSGQDPQKVQVADGQTVYFLYTFIQSWVKSSRLLATKRKPRDG